ncbi:MAG: translation initiation factor eIF-2B [Candidatus Dojkabacteria bacterium]|nr:translation initiation factor eIF-2B [Candidatus Dojkabacteria bacterium]
MEIPTNIAAIIKDIETLKIQGATAVAQSCFEGIRLYLEEHSGTPERIELFLSEIEKIGLQLVHARPNEPLARNGLKFLLNTYRIRYPGEQDPVRVKEHLLKVMDEFLAMLERAKKNIVEVGVNKFSGTNGVLTHCHSSTVEHMCTGMHERRQGEPFSVVATETRPLFQGRITAKNLVQAGLDVKMIVDSAVTSFLVGDWDIPVDVVFIGCDQISMSGDTVNKVGSYGIALSSYFASKPVYVVGTLLKLDPATIYDRPRIEMRSPEEIWPDAPENLQIINPAFEIIPHELITGFVTEFGVLKPEELEREMGKQYNWLW